MKGSLAIHDSTRAVKVPLIFEYLWWSEPSLRRHGTLCQLGGNHLSTFFGPRSLCGCPQFGHIDRENAMRNPILAVSWFLASVQLGRRMKSCAASNWRVGDFRLPHRNLQVGCGCGSYRVLWQSQFWGFPKRTDAGGPSPKLSSKLVAGDSLTRGNRVAVKKDTQILKPIC